MAPSNNHSCQVVVADDNRIFRTNLVRFLATIPNLEVVAQAANGEEALQCVEASDPHILLLDIQMPVMNGIEVLHRLQAMTTRVHVVVLSAHSESYADQALASGAIAFVSKGDIPQLLAILSRVIKEC
jgi:YesN/AraC family two-component response regulator